MIVAIDVDLTVVDSLTPWFGWLAQYSDEKVVNADGAYHLAPEMQAILARAGRSDINPVDYWRQPNLYDNMKPLPGSQECIKALRSMGANIVFVSSCFPEHTESKVRMLENNFEMDGFIATHDKHFVSYNAIIDDKLEHHELGNMFRPSAKHILFTGVREDGTEEQRKKYLKLSHWNSSVMRKILEA